MDQVADFHQIYKVKTIGDAFFAIAGLPHTIAIAEGQRDDHTLRMMKFTCHCIQIFSGKYIHPEAQTLLQAAATKNSLLQRQQRH